jgi:hypothetical protein
VVLVNVVRDIRVTHILGNLLTERLRSFSIRPSLYAVVKYSYFTLQGFQNKRKSNIYASGEPQLFSRFWCLPTFAESNGQPLDVTFLRGCRRRIWH